MTRAADIGALMIPGERAEYDLDPASRASRRDRAVSILGAVAVHAALAATVMLMTGTVAPTPESPVVIEMLPLPARPSALHIEAAVTEEPKPLKPAVEQEPVEIVEAAPAAPADIAPAAPVPASAAVAPEPPLPKPGIARPERLRPMPAPAPVGREAEPKTRVATAPAAPAPAVPEPLASPAPSTAEASAAYAARLVAWLERYKTYPRAARLRRIEGHIVLRLALAPNGKVKAATLEHGSGALLLDRAALDMVRRADPMPPLPPALGAGGEFLVPVAFTLERP